MTTRYTRLLMGAGIGLWLIAGCAEPDPVIPGALTAADERADVEGLALDREALEEVPAELEAEAVEALRQLEEDLDALRTNPAVVKERVTALREEPRPDAVALATLTAGDRVTVEGPPSVDHGFVQVRLPSGATGYLRAEVLHVGEVEELYCFDHSPLFERPDSTTPPKAWLPMATSVLVLEVEGPWVGVLLADGERGWMFSADLAEDPAVLDLGGS